MGVSFDTSRSMVTRADIDAARRRIKDVAFKTPLLRFPVLDDAVDGTILIKPENLQRTGSFKFRGAYNCLSQIPEKTREKGVVACSSGNHAQGVAESARLLGIPATIVMPETAPKVKLQRTQDAGARVITYKRGVEDRYLIAADIQQQTGATFVHPFNDPHVIAGQGTVGAEIAEQADALGLKPDAVLACTGGGGLSSGIALALDADLPGTVFHTVEPREFDDYRRSLSTGELQRNEKAVGSVCDALMSESPGEIGFSILSRLAGEGVAVSDNEALRAVAYAFRELKLVVEPGGAAALAAVLTGRFSARNRVVCVVLTGGNVDLAMLERALHLGKPGMV
ncbi:MAG: threonine/serine dehydratase [Roseibium sp.]|nr:threonine/serine dehydratase [Roseibium sp.]